jgi:hypothetical protein
LSVASFFFGSQQPENKEEVEKRVTEAMKKYDHKYFTNLKQDETDMD